MRIGILYNRDRHALHALRLLIPRISAHELVLFHTSRVGTAANTAPADLVALQAYESNIDAQLNVLAGLPDECLNAVNEPAGLALLKQLSPDLLISIRFGKILRQPAIDCAKLGVINLHSGLLPSYRGVMPTFWSMLNEASTIGTTLHWIVDPTIDTGPAIAVTRQPLLRHVSYCDQVTALYGAGVDRIIEAVNNISTGELRRPEPAPTDPVSGAYYGFPDAQDCARFLANGWRWIP